MRASDGTLVEVFEWKSQRAIDAAHADPEVQRMWQQYAAVCEYVPPATLAEAGRLFGGFESVRLPLQPLPLSHLPNHVQVDARLGTSGFLTAESLDEIADAGYRVLVNLLPADHRSTLADEADRAARRDMRYHHIPVDFAAPQEADLRAFETTMQGVNPDARVWVHCAANYRVTAFIALYGSRRLGWDRERAEALIAEVWTPDDTWRAFIEAHA